MIQTISIGHLLREAVATPYRNLVTRPTGAAVRNRIQARLAGTNCLTALLDFSEIELLDFSCADEVVAKLLLSRVAGTPRFFVLRGLREDQHEAIEHVLTHHRLAVAALAHGGVRRVLGWVTPDARAAFARVCDQGPMTPLDLAGATGWPEPRAAGALDALAIHRLVRSDGVLYHPLPIA